MKLIEKLDSKFYKYKLYNLIKSDYLVRTLFFAAFGAIITLGFALFNGLFGILLQSVWYGIFAIYYIILFLQKMLLILVYLICLKKFKDNPEKLTTEKIKIYLANGIIFIPLTISLAVIISIFFTSEKPYITGDILAISIAAFTCYKITMAIINIIKAKSVKDDILQTIRNINLVESIISIVLLTNTLITTFGKFDSDMKIITALSGLASCIAIISIGIYMINNSIKKFEYKNHTNKIK